MPSEAWKLVKTPIFPSRGVPVGGRFFLGCIRRFQLRARLGRPWHHWDISSLTNPTVQISRSGLLRQDSPDKSRHGGSEVAATDDLVEARCIASRSSGFRACDDSATSARS